MFTDEVCENQIVLFLRSRVSAPCSFHSEIPFIDRLNQFLLAMTYAFPLPRPRGWHLLFGCICNRMRFFFDFKISSASFSNTGASNTSKNISLIADAVSLSIRLFVISTPPNALSGSPARACFHASTVVALEAMPHTFVCFMIANVRNEFWDSMENSRINWIAASISTRLL